ncbi:hypothetical protein GOBAR_AA30914 [Gossypium barbadense]|uniref:Nudix hydrolase domain-containing protein n=1 Tax=Gossypium barbadense TaxID=3634 RepID=A0A2P5WFE3_GOSBA|nr:hypothetical protein GOBAR_AA30914 [Gossypium barbadense]
MAVLWRSFSLYSPFHLSVPPKPICSYFSPSSCTCSSSSSMEAPPQGYRRNVGICLINSSKKKRIVWTEGRGRKDGEGGNPRLVWGGIDDNEDPKVAALRELKEETGVRSAEVLAEAKVNVTTIKFSTATEKKGRVVVRGTVPYWLTYDFPPEVREKLKHQWGSDWKGQAQKWFLLKFTGKEEEINLLGDGSEKPEFGEWSWMTPEQIVEHAVDFKKPVYNKVLEVFTPYLH